MQIQADRFEQRQTKSRFMQTDRCKFMQTNPNRCRQKADPGIQMHIQADEDSANSCRQMQRCNQAESQPDKSGEIRCGLNVIKAAIDNVRESVSYWKTTPKRVEKFKETCRQLKTTYSKTLGLDCQTRWNATFLMLKTALMYKDDFTHLKQRDSHYKTLPSLLEWENVQVICKKLEVFHNVTVIFSGTRYTTTNLYFSKVSDIMLKLNEWLVSLNQLVSKLASLMIENFDEYWGAIHELMVVASVFDPRSKMEMIKFYFSKIYPAYSAIRIQNFQICENISLKKETEGQNSSYRKEQHERDPKFTSRQRCYCSQIGPQR
nr:zinc finger BED domain-containing protein RICESLEEPER 2-like [Tanacetum cinerariifolium]